jgi:hypothetical protein
MSARDQLNSYIGQIERRLRMGAAVRGAAILAAAALAVTILLVLIANAFAFVSWSIISARFILAAALIYAASFGLALPLLRLNRRRAAARAEAAFPDFKQRLVTFAERDAAREPFLELLAADTLRLAQSFEPKRLVTNRALLASCGAGLAALGVLAWLIAAAPGFIGYGAALLWRGSSAIPTSSSPRRPSASSPRECVSSLATTPPRNGTSFPCSRSPAAQDSSSPSRACPKALNTTSRPVRSARAASKFVSSICPA